MNPGPMVYGLGGNAWIARCDMETMAHDENCANAVLVASAPELLSALRGLLNASPDRPRAVMEARKVACALINRVSPSTFGVSPLPTPDAGGQ